MKIRNKEIELKLQTPDLLGIRQRDGRNKILIENEENEDEEMINGYKVLEIPSISGSNK